MVETIVFTPNRTYFHYETAGSSPAFQNAKITHIKPAEIKND